VANLEKLLQTKLAEAEEKHKYNIKTPTEENNCLRYGIFPQGSLAGLLLRAEGCSSD
jgi:hypothetical protein